MKYIGQKILLGVAIGDALGVPYEFSSREDMESSPAKDMVGFRVHNQPLGTWSDDSSLTFCLAESMVNGYSLESTASNFVNWKNNAYWTAHDEVFDIGITTTKSLSELQEILVENKMEDLALLKYSGNEFDNGNGSLMRILPLIFEVKGKDIKTQFDIIWENSALTHKHIRAAMCCMIYLKFVEHLITGIDKISAYEKTRTDILGLWNDIGFSEAERKHFNRIIKSDIYKLDKEEILSGGYVIESLEASLWSFLSTESYKEAVLTSINLGHDTDTTGAITGGLAGVYYGIHEIPEFWLASLVKKKKIIELGDRLDISYSI